MRLLAVVLGALLLALTGCEADETLDPEEAAVVAAVEDVSTACGDRDRERLQDRSADLVRDRLRDRDRVMLFGSDDATLTLLSRTVSVDEDTATATVVHELTIDGTTTEVERTWVFERTADGDWVLAELPDCPFRD
jgi:hypothetical protein